MPLSKERDRQRKRLIRLERLVTPPQHIKIVQPKPETDAGPYWGNYGGRDYKPNFDAEGNVIPEYY